METQAHSLAAAGSGGGSLFPELSSENRDFLITPSGDKVHFSFNSSLLLFSHCSFLLPSLSCELQWFPLSAAGSHSNFRHKPINFPSTEFWVFVIDPCSGLYPGVLPLYLFLFVVNAVFSIWEFCVGFSFFTCELC